MPQIDAGYLALGSIAVFAPIRSDRAQDYREEAYQEAPTNSFFGFSSPLCWGERERESERGRDGDEEGGREKKRGRDRSSTRVLSPELEHQCC